MRDHHNILFDAWFKKYALYFSTTHDAISDMIPDLHDASGSHSGENMQPRLLTLTKNYSLFLFGARGVGKSTLVTKTYNIGTDESCYLNLLDTTIEDRFARNPIELAELVDALPEHEKYVIIDEIQKVPKLLDVIHLLIESKKCKKYFILTGSSARKLKISGVNLLAGRAVVYHLYPFSCLEFACL